MQQKLIVRDMPVSERPRERLLKHGPGALSTAELLAIIIRCGTRGEDVLTLSRRIITECPIETLKTITPGRLKAFPGISDAKAAEIMAVFEIAKRASRTTDTFRLKISTSKDAFDYLAHRMSHLKKEHLVGLYLDTRNSLIREETISVGTLDSSLVHPREIFRPAVEEACASVIIVHNHPSGDPEPSREDIEATRRLIKASEIMSIDLLDHIIIGHNRYLSLKDENLL